MFNPKYRVLIKSECFPKDNVICLGTQLIDIIKFINNFLPSHIWYSADIEALESKINLNKFKGFRLKRIGSDFQFTEFCSKIMQFIWGVFLCLDSNLLSQNIQEIELGTEDEPFRPINCNGIILEIRAFDTSFFEIYSVDLALMKELSKHYNVSIEQNPESTWSKFFQKNRP